MCEWCELSYSGIVCVDAACSLPLECRAMTTLLRSRTPLVHIACSIAYSSFLFLADCPRGQQMVCDLSEWCDPFLSRRPGILPPLQGQRNAAPLLPPLRPPSCAHQGGPPLTLYQISTSIEIEPSLSYSLRVRARNVVFSYPLAPLFSLFSIINP